LFILYLPTWAYQKLVTLQAQPMILSGLALRPEAVMEAALMLAYAAYIVITYPAAVLGCNGLPAVLLIYVATRRQKNRPQWLRKALVICAVSLGITIVAFVLDGLGLVPFPIINN
jgi:hypothetical protein